MRSLKPFLLLYITGILLLILSFIDGKKIIDIHFHDTYYVMSTATLYTMLSLVLLLFGIVYHMTQKFLFSKILTWIHVIGSIAAAILILLIVIPATQKKGTALQSPGLVEAMSIVVGLGVICQLLFPLNIIGGALKKRSQKNQ